LTKESLQRLEENDTDKKNDDEELDEAEDSLDKEYALFKVYFKYGDYLLLELVYFIMSAFVMRLISN